MPAVASQNPDGSYSDLDERSTPVLGWISAILLTLLFIGAMVVYPPLLDASGAVPMPDWAKMLGRFHVVALHLPVGVLFLAAFMELAAMFSRKGRVYLTPATTFSLHIASWGAAIAVVMGVLLSRKGGFGSPLFQAHQMLGIAAAVGLLVTLILKLLVDGSGELRWIYRGIFGLTVLVLSVGAHFGGNLVHGSDYLIKYAPPEIRDNVAKVEDAILDKFKLLMPASKEADPSHNPPADNATVDAEPAATKPETTPPVGGTVYAALVAPLLEAKCNSCHNAEKSKAGLRLDSHELILKGSENGEVLVVGDPTKSKIISALILPMDDDDHMPPPKEKQPSKEEIELLSWWVKEGAPLDLKVADAKFPDSLKTLVQGMLASTKGGSAGGTPPIILAEAAAEAPDLAVAEAMKKINGSGASLAPVAADSKELRFTALNVAKDFKDAGLKDLEPIADKIVALDVAKSAVTDAGMATVAKMTKLRELHLENTAVTDAGVAQLKGLAQLEYLNIYGTKCTDKALADLAGLEKLKSLYAWQTGVTKAGVDAFKAKRPNTMVNTGWSEADNAKVVASAPASAPAPAPVPAKPEAPKPAAPAPAPAKPVVAAATPAAPKPATPAPATPAPATPTVPAKPAEPAAAPAKPATPTVAANPEANLYKDVVAPILAAKCTKCHGTEKTKGKLRLDSLAGILKGGSDGATTAVAGKPGDSLMVKRAKLPDDDDDHMPPKDETQLNKDEIAILTWWIEQGASDSLTIANAKKTPEIEASLKLVMASRSAGAVAKSAEKPKPKALTPEEKKAIAGVAAKMTALNASLMPLALDTEQLRFGCINAADKFGDKELEELAPIATQVLWVDLARSKVTDACAPTLAKFTNLERLHLENTAVTDATLDQLAGLKDLEYLNLYGTKVTDAGVAKLAADKALKKLFVWQTSVTKEGAKKLEAAVPGLVVNVGLSEAEIAKLVEEAKPPQPPPAPAKPAKKAEAKPAEAKPAPAVKLEAAPKPATPAPATPAPATPAPAPAKTTPAPAPAASTPPPSPAPVPNAPQPNKPADAPPAPKK